jgi:glutamate/tyrosine decarboxylase-like PLP-dependent enzyme
LFVAGTFSKEGLVDDKYHFLAHFLGPKAENEEFFEHLASRVIRDYCYWRRNYFPQDPILLTSVRRRELEEEFDSIERHLDVLMADLRRTFPFYSPRYIGHQQSEVSLTSVLGFLAGLLYNPNNVTSESGAVTVDCEIEVCAEVMRMLGFRPAPNAPLTNAQIPSYHKELQKQFGWAHLTSGGTSANIEALWVARSVRYSVVGLLAAAKKLHLDVHIKTAADTSKNFRKLTPRAALALKVNEIIYLHGRLVEALIKREGVDPGEAQRILDLETAEEGLAHGYGSVFSKFPPVLLVSGAAHYSFRKAADILGIGRENVELIDMDSHFRLAPRSLSDTLERVTRQGRLPVAVIGIVGTTEEGAIDPIHAILDIKRDWERSHEQSFWLHIDGAWGGFLRSLFKFRDKRPIFEKRLAGLWKSLTGEEPAGTSPVAQLFRALLEREKGTHVAERFESLHESKRFPEALNVIATALDIFPEPSPPGHDFQLRTIDTVNAVGDYVSATIQLPMGEHQREISLRWSHWDIGSPILAIEEADSVTVDPHKLGFTPYPIGLIAFANDRVRRFIAEDAPYITTQGRTTIAHMPPRHLKSVEDFGRSRVATLAFAPFTLEGSRPGAAATAFWLSVRALPLDQENHGSVLRSSILAARTLHEWLKHWDRAMAEVKRDEEFLFLPLVEHMPDSNIVLFVVKKKIGSSIASCNNLTSKVYSRFSIRAELGQREYSYAQPFFLSSTVMLPPAYSLRTLAPFLERAGFREQDTDYPREGLFVLRATVQNPYLTPLRTEEQCDLIGEFVRELSNAAREAVADLASRNRR